MFEISITSVFNGLNRINHFRTHSLSLRKSSFKINSICRMSAIYTQYIKKRNRYIFADNLSNFKDVDFKLAGFID